jgi:hypothetical protein
MQSKKRSLVESCSNVAIGFGVAFISQRIIFPFFDVHISLADNFLITIWFTFISIIRSYCLRRFFTRKD